MTMINQKNKAFIWDLYQRLNHIPLDKLPGLIEAKMHPDVAWFGPHPINKKEGVEQVIAQFWLPLRQSFPDIKRHCDVFMGGESGGEHWVSSIGYFTGTFHRDWLGIPATSKKTNIHYGQFYRLEEGLIVESYMILDIMAVMRQAGFQVLPPALGAEGGKILPPATKDGVMLLPQDPLATFKTRESVAAMIDGMMRFDGVNLESMEMDKYWHEDFHWYGTTGIGSCYSLEQFQDFHQKPWLVAFPDRGLHESADSGRLIGLRNNEILAEGNFASLGLWDGVFSYHKGPFKGVKPTGKLMKMRDFDWYRRDGQKLAQNWVPMDLIDIFLQMGVDLFDRLYQQVEDRKRKGELI